MALTVGLLPLSAHAEITSATAPATVPAAASAEAPEKEPGIGYRLLLYLPNRVLDLCDIVRLRVRVGPGAAMGLRATTVLDFFLGSYASVFAGLPGPRMQRSPKWPLGLESYNGIKVSLAKAAVSGGIGPGYSPTEFGVSLHPLLLGIDFGLDPYEALDFVTGLVLIDLRDDEI